MENLRVKIHEYITAWEQAEKEEDGTNRIFNGDNNARSDRSQKPWSGTYSNNRGTHATVGWKTFNSSNNAHKPDSMEWSGTQGSMGSAEFLVTNTRSSSLTRYYDQCRYCEQRHWSDECTKHRPIDERKRQLRDSFYKCLKVGHISKDCKNVELVYTAVR